ncbi:Sensor histidine kinase LiaS [[Clostridium] ultunense Esp]|uniref:HAMP domain-containing sensor histidine kinase n=1 Tax=Thermicanus aegyptius TaxID=94009 RepID=UPI0002B6FA91|nr:histidine kinase [Thermicanus aegyptius]CCQ94861.1 Sensor histidine kinase LiaS [[Clostridium] ultunense Esp]
MELERRFHSILWNAVRVFLYATVGSSLLFIAFLIFFMTGGLFLFQEGSVIYQLLVLLKGEGSLWLLFFLFLLSLLSSLVVGVVSGLASGRKLKQDLESFSWATEKYARGDLDYRIPINGNDEFAELARQFNKMAERFEGQVGSLQKLVEENAELLGQSKQVAVHEERQRLARELHDSISQQLFAIMMQLAALRLMIEKDPAQAKERFHIVEEMAAAAQAEMRALLLHLRPVALKGKKLTEALQALLDELKEKHPIQYEWTMDTIDPLPKGLEEHLFRIVQEGISNAVRHSHAQKIELHLLKQRSALILRIKDDGVGFRYDERKVTSSMGLGTIRERVGEMGGVVELTSTPGKGTILEIRIPIVYKGEEADGENPHPHRG